MAVSSGDIMQDGTYDDDDEQRYNLHANITQKW